MNTAAPLSLLRLNRPLAALTSERAQPVGVVHQQLVLVGLHAAADERRQPLDVVARHLGVRAPLQAEQLLGERHCGRRARRVREGVQGPHLTPRPGQAREQLTRQTAAHGGGGGGG